MFTGTSSDEQNIEGSFGLSFDLFQFSNPEVDLSASSFLYVGISEWGRLRPDVDFRLTWELIKDFDLGIRGYVQADNRPAEGATKVDYAITTTIGYSWD